jgi:hypothetical protein
VHYVIVDDRLAYFAYFTNWGIIQTTIFFTLALASRANKTVDKVACIWFHIIWVFNWCISLAFWGYLFPIGTFANLVRVTMTHSVPLMLTIIDFFLNRITFVRAQFVVGFSVLLGYLFCVLMPYTLTEEPLYKGIDFKGWLSYAIVVGLMLVSVAMFEAGKWVKETMEKSLDSEKEQHLIEGV